MCPSRSCYYQFTAINDCTRVRVLRLYDRLNQTAIQFLDYALERLPFRVEVIQTDNGSEFQATFHWHVLDRGIGHVYIKPLRPCLNGKVERSHRIDAEEFYRLLNGLFHKRVSRPTVRLHMLRQSVARWFAFCRDLCTISDSGSGMRTS